MQSQVRTTRRRAARVAAALALAAAAFASVTTAQSQSVASQSAGEAVKARQPDVTRAAGAIGAWFPAGTGPESGIKTDAKPEVWADAGGFAAAQQTFVGEAEKWTQLVAGTDASAWKDAAVSLGRSCKGCHEKYRVKRD